MGFIFSGELKLELLSVMCAFFTRHHSKAVRFVLTVLEYFGRF